MAKLKACPFCGGKAHIMKMGFPHWIYCEQCGARVQGGTCQEKDSVAAWNRRYKPDPPKHCGNCAYLDVTNITANYYICRRPDHYWRTDTAYLKNKWTPACKAFKPRESVKNGKMASL